jgi:hypothetical protein
MIESVGKRELIATNWSKMTGFIVLHNIPTSTAVLIANLKLIYVIKTQLPAYIYSFLFSNDVSAVQ